jgi:hypothetical protein
MRASSSLHCGMSSSRFVGALLQGAPGFLSSEIHRTQSMQS